MARKVVTALIDGVEERCEVLDSYEDEGRYSVMVLAAEGPYAHTGFMTSVWQRGAQLTNEPPVAGATTEQAVLPGSTTVMTWLELAPELGLHLSYDQPSGIMTLMRDADHAVFVSLFPVQGEYVLQARNGHRPDGHPHWTTAWEAGNRVEGWVRAQVSLFTV